MSSETELVPEMLAQRIHFVRGHKVMLDADLALLYKVETRILVQAVKRNLRRFPSDFTFQLTDEEWVVLRSQNVTSKGKSTLLQLICGALFPTSGSMETDVIRLLVNDQFGMTNWRC